MQSHNIRSTHSYQLFAVSYNWLTKSSDEMLTNSAGILVLPSFGRIFVIVLVSSTKISDF